MTKPPELRYCVRCVLPSSAATPLEFDDEGVCTGCRVDAQKSKIDWDARTEELKEIFEQHRSRDGSNYDCVIPVSGGKDSYFQTHLVTSSSASIRCWSPTTATTTCPTGWRNLHRMREVFGCDHVMSSPERAALLKKLNRLGFRVMGDMNWHAHVGITTAPVQDGRAARHPAGDLGRARLPRPRRPVLASTTSPR